MGGVCEGDGKIVYMSRHKEIQFADYRGNGHPSSNGRVAFRSVGNEIVFTAVYQEGTISTNTVNAAEHIVIDIATQIEIDWPDYVWHDLQTAAGYTMWIDRRALMQLNVRIDPKAPEGIWVCNWELMRIEEKEYLISGLLEVIGLSDCV
jgi:hypothetical protein